MRYIFDTIRRRALLQSGAICCALGALVAPVLPAAARHAEPDKTAYPQIATQCRVIDGDTLRCDSGRIRLLGIDAPELPGHCAQGRDCAPGDPFASSRSLAQAMGDGTRLRIRIIGADRYGRTLAMVMGAAGDLSCWQLAHGQAIYKPRWDNGGVVAMTCPAYAR